MKRSHAFMAIFLAGAASLIFPASMRAQSDPSAPVRADPLFRADLDMKRVMESFAVLEPKPIETLTPQEARKQPTPADAVKSQLEAEAKSTAPEGGVRVRDLTYPGPGGPLAVRIYMPEGADQKSPLPVIVYYHGGGWVLAGLDAYDASPRAIAKQTNAIVVSAEYRQAPEHKFPAAHEDAVAAYRWVLDNAASWGGDPRRIAVMGEGSGGNLAINVAIAARNQNLQKPVQQVLIYPIAGVNMSTRSYEANVNARPLNKPAMNWLFAQVIKSDRDKEDPRLDLVGKADLKDLPPATIVTAEIDPLRTEGQSLASKLRQQGVNADARDYTGVTHDFFGMGSLVSQAREAQIAVAKDLKAAFDNTRTGSTGGDGRTAAEPAR